MLRDDRLQAERTSDQAEGLRQRRRSDDAAAQRPGSSTRRPCVVLLSELPATDTGARFALHLAQSLATRTSGRSPGRSLLVDLAPAASRLPRVMSDAIADDGFPTLWNQLAAGAKLPVVDVSTQSRVAVVAQPSLMLPPVDQLPRLYDELARQIDRDVRWDWIVLLAADHLLPFDQACWQAAQDILLIADGAVLDCRRHSAVLRSRLPRLESDRRLWSMSHGRPSGPIGWWLGSWRRDRSRGWRCGWSVRSDGAASAAGQWMAEGITPRPLPRASWPRLEAPAALERGWWGDRLLQRSAHTVAEALQLATGRDDRRGEPGCDDTARFAGWQKKIQLRAELRPINELSEAFRA